MAKRKPKTGDMVKHHEHPNSRFVAGEVKIEDTGKGQNLITISLDKITGFCRVRKDISVSTISTLEEEHLTGKFEILDRYVNSVAKKLCDRLNKSLNVTDFIYEDKKFISKTGNFKIQKLKNNTISDSENLIIPMLKQTINFFEVETKYE